ncbi:MAG: tetratricopeptide repeat protein [Okeania sp. SIO2G4]|uniref:glycosyltransferase n=1 Tax=unclassified Okeania TaxID=2634635 RepID=UPI0013B64A50|nr:MULTISPECIES: glycosyltransferase [unclassified Okeania]NEP72080.1 tetratricopeptide repeat protein [Okeania sp. SIO2G5]NEP92938.1 tetratricopeptide repeat protein [Okeania sp. SIO2F5]NEQ91058.1 tetratricopeptide repeat protein [Okeania sp. SIO2G4]
MNLSFCIIVKNEEKNLPRCLASVKDTVDEMVVLDTGSTDRTPEIAQEFGAKVHYFEWCNDFAAARNESLKYVTGDWVLVLDADEYLSPKIAPHIQEAIKSDHYILINLIREEIGAQQSPYSLVSRLFRNHPEIKFSRPYHAIVDDSITEILAKESHWEIASLPDIAVLHEGYQKGEITSKNKLQRAKAAMESYFNNHPNDVYVCSKLGALYIEIGEKQKGMELLFRGLQDPQIDKTILYELHYHLAIAYRQQQDREKAKSHYKIATELNVMPKLKLGAYNNLGSLLKEEGNLQDAKINYEIALQIDPNFAVAHYNRGMVLKEMGWFTEAIASYQKAIQLDSNYAEAYQNLGVVLLKVGQVQESLEAFGKAISLHEKYNPTEAKRIRQGLESMGFIL